MHSLSDLYTLAEAEKIPIYTFHIPQNGSISLLRGDSCAIAMDPAMLDGGIQERVHLGHELGHCMTGAFYSIYTRVDSRRRHENRADKWAIREMIPVEELDDAVAEGCTGLWELAERFGVTEEFMRKAVCWYVHGNLATELYF